MSKNLSKRSGFVQLRPLNQNPEKRKKRPDFFVCDIETQNWTKFLVIGTYDGKTLKHFKKLSLFLDFVFDAYNGNDCFAHFGGRFDFLFIIGEILRTDKYEITEMVPRGSGLLYFECHRRDDGAKITFRDSSALLGFALKRLTESFNVEHKKLDWDHEKTNGVTPELLEYLDSDLKGLYEVLQKFYAWPIIEKAGGAYTIASQAMRVLRTYLQLPIPSLSRTLDRRIRHGYLGGRVEIFKPLYKSKKPLYAFDVNSLYPFVMSQNQFPGAFKYETYEYEKDRLAFYRASVSVPEKLHIPSLGILRDGKYIFPTGQFSGFWSSAELAYAKTLGCKIEIEIGYVFDSAGFIFRDFVNDLYKIRMEAGKGSVGETIAKLLMNSCYGKFGQNQFKENIVFDDGSVGLKPLREIKVDGKTYRLMTKAVELEGFTNVAIAAFVTSYARIHMHKLMMEAPHEMYYTDTDSLFTTHKYKSGSGLGELKLEDTVYSACFLLPKTYMAGKKIAMKGFDKKKIQHFTMDDFHACLEGDLKSLKIISEPKFATFKTALRSGAMVGMTKESTRQIRSKYDKRIIIKKGNSYETKPIRIEA